MKHPGNTIIDHFNDHFNPFVAESWASHSANVNQRWTDNFAVNESVFVEKFNCQLKNCIKINLKICTEAYTYKSGHWFLERSENVHRGERSVVRFRKTWTILVDVLCRVVATDSVGIDAVKWLLISANQKHKTRNKENYFPHWILIVQLSLVNKN